MSTVSSDLRVYRLQIMNFLMSMTIKFAPLAVLTNNSRLTQGYAVDADNPQTWKYYLNLTGQYHVSDTMMSVMSLDTHQIIDFTIANLSQHPRTRAAYIPGTTYYTKLCTKYPSQTDLIKNIVYPVPDIDAAIDADDFTILQYQGDFLESTEEGYIVNYLLDTIEFIQSRYYPSQISYELYFNVTFWGQFWHRLVEACFTARFMAIKTINVHSWHVWQYLESEGLGDYSDILPRETQMFLYRNMRYIKANQGKQSTLTILANNLLASLSVGLYGRDVYQQTLTDAASFRLTPELVATAVPTSFNVSAQTVPAESISDMNARLYAIGDEVDSSAEHVNAVEATLSGTTLNTYPTKILELRPLPRERRYASFFNNFVMDHLVYLIQNGFYAPSVILYADVTEKSIFLSGKDTLALLYYCIQRTYYQTATVVPTTYTSRTAYKLVQPTINPHFQWMGMTYQTKMFVKYDQWQQAIAYPARKLSAASDFSNLLSNMFVYTLQWVVESRLTADLVEQEALHSVVEQMVEQGTFSLSLSDKANYSDWFAEHADVYQNFIVPYELLHNPQASYEDLITQIFTQLLPMTEIMQNYGNFAISTSGYEKLKNLFISLCSYNVTFVDTTRDIFDAMAIEEEGCGSLNKSMSKTTSVPIEEYLDFSTTASNAMTVEMESLEVGVTTTVSSSIAFDLADSLELSTSGSNSCTALEEVPVSPIDRAGSSAVGVDTDFAVAVGSV